MKLVKINLDTPPLHKGRFKGEVKKLKKAFEHLYRNRSKIRCNQTTPDMFKSN